MTLNKNKDVSAEQLGHYTLLERIGDGSLGPAFRARDTVLGRTVLVRDVYERFRGDPVVRAHLLKQTRAAAAVSHPNVARLFEVGEGPDELFLVFEFVSGQTLDEAQGGQPLGVRQTVALGVQLADALGAGHAKGVRHLDVRPSTIKLSRRGHATLLDLGLGTWAARRPLSSTSGASGEVIPRTRSVRRGPFEACRRPAAWLGRPARR